MKIVLSLLLVAVAVHGYLMPVLPAEICPVCCRSGDNFRDGVNGVFNGVTNPGAGWASPPGNSWKHPNRASGYRWSSPATVWDVFQNAQLVSGGGCLKASPGGTLPGAVPLNTVPKRTAADYDGCCAQLAHCCPATQNIQTNGAYGCCRAAATNGQDCTTLANGNFDRCVDKYCPAGTTATLSNGNRINCGAGFKKCPSGSYCNPANQQAWCCTGTKPAQCDYANCGACTAGGCFWSGNVCLEFCPATLGSTTAPIAKKCSNKCTCYNNNWDKPNLNTGAFIAPAAAWGPWGPVAPASTSSQAIPYSPAFAVPGTCRGRCGTQGWHDQVPTGAVGPAGFGGPGFGFGGGFGGFGGGWGYGMPFGGFGGYGFRPPVPPRANTQTRCSCDDSCDSRGDCCFDKCGICGAK